MLSVVCLCMETIAYVRSKLVMRERVVNTRRISHLSKKNRIRACVFVCVLWISILANQNQCASDETIYRILVTNRAFATKQYSYRNICFAHSTETCWFFEQCGRPLSAQITLRYGRGKGFQTSRVWRFKKTPGRKLPALWAYDMCLLSSRNRIPEYGSRSTVNASTCIAITPD